MAGSLSAGTKYIILKRTHGPEDPNTLTYLSARILGGMGGSATTHAHVRHQAQENYELQHTIHNRSSRQDVQGFKELSERRSVVLRPGTETKTR